MFSIVNCFQMFKPGRVVGRRGQLQIQTREPIKSIRTASSLTENGKRHCVHQNMQSNKMNIIQHIALTFYLKYSDATHF